MASNGEEIIMATITIDGTFTVLKVDDTEIARVKTSDVALVARLQGLAATINSILD